MLHAGLDLSDTVWMSHVINQAGAPVLVTQAGPCPRARRQRPRPGHRPGPAEL
jgi:hypothetical protein